MKRSKASSRPKPGSFKSSLPPKYAKKFTAQKREERLARNLKARIQQAYDARDAFKPRKADRGKLLFIGTRGERSPSKKGRKGYPIYVTKTGKKWLIRQSGERPYQARTLSELVLPDRANLRSQVKNFQKRRLVRIGRIRTIVKQAGSVKSGGEQDFSERVSDKIAASIRAALRAQRSHRVFLIKFNVLVRLPDGTTVVIPGQVPIERPDHIYIRLAGIRNFVRQKFYGFMARGLAYQGYVSNGSANHIRNLPVNKGKERDQWENPADPDHKFWQGRRKAQVEIIKIEWRIEQAQ